MFEGQTAQILSHSESEESVNSWTGPITPPTALVSSAHTTSRTAITPAYSPSITDTVRRFSNMEIDDQFHEIFHHLHGEVPQAETGSSSSSSSLYVRLNGSTMRGRPCSLDGLETTKTIRLSRAPARTPKPSLDTFVAGLVEEKPSFATAESDSDVYDGDFAMTPRCMAATSTPHRPSLRSSTISGIPASSETQYRPPPLISRRLSFNSSVCKTTTAILPQPRFIPSGRSFEPVRKQGRQSQSREPSASGFQDVGAVAVLKPVGGGVRKAIERLEIASVSAHDQSVG